MLHNKLRGQVYPSASNMEYMVSTASDAWLYFYLFFFFFGHSARGAEFPLKLAFLERFPGAASFQSERCFRSLGCFAWNRQQ